MNFITFNDLTAEQREAALKKWPRREGGEAPESFLIAFSTGGDVPLFRRLAQLSTPAEVEPVEPAAAAPVAEAGLACVSCGRGGFTSRQLGGHRRHCKGPVTPEAASAPDPVPAAPVVEGSPNRLGMSALAGSALEAAVAGDWPLSAPLSVSLRDPLGDTARLEFDIAGGKIIRLDAGNVEGSRIEMIPLDLLDESKTNPRTVHEQEAHEELCGSFRALGWLPASPALVRRKAGPGVIVAPLDPSDPDPARWVFCHPDSRERLAGLGECSREEAEALAATKYACRYEIVWAHRRTRAARSVGLKEAPAVIGVFSDAEVMELQLIENVQRVGLSAMDEAEHLRRLLALREVGGKPLHTRHTLAAKIGKTEKHVARVVMLCRLDGETRAAVASGKLKVSIAYELARIPDGEVRDAATREILNPSQGVGPMRYNAASEYIQRTCSKNLREAKFDRSDASLVPVRNRIDLDGADGTARYFGGSCLDCPFNSANADDERAARAHQFGVCGNIACFEAKTAADFEVWRAAHNKPEAGKVALTAERNAEIFDDLGEIDWKAGLVPLNAAPDAGELSEEKVAAHGGEVGTWKDLTAGKLSEVLVARHPKTGRKVEVVSIEAAKAAAELNGRAIFKTSKAPRFKRNADGDAQHKAHTLDAKRYQELTRRVEERLLSNCATKAAALGYLPAGGWRFLAGWIAGVAAAAALAKVERRRQLDPGSLGDALAEMSDAEIVGLSVEIVLADYYAEGCDEGGNEGLAVFGVSLEKVTAEINAAMGAAPIESPASAPAAPSAPAGDGLPLPFGDGWRAHRFTHEVFETFAHDGDGVFTAPDLIFIELEEIHKEGIRIELHAAYSRAGGVPAWSMGYQLDGGEWREFVEANVNAGVIYKTRFAAFAEAAIRVSRRLDSEERVGRAARIAMRKLVDAMTDFGEAEAFRLEQTEPATPAAETCWDGVKVEEVPIEEHPDFEALKERYGWDEETRSFRNSPIMREADGFLKPAPAPSHLVYLTTHGMNGDGKPWAEAYDATEHDRAMTDPLIVWVCAVAGLDTVEAAIEAAIEALNDGAGVITARGEALGFKFPAVNVEEVLP